jgi:ferredoxin--NADP+ reductase
VVVLGRRGPAEAAFTVGELVGLAGHEGIDVVVDTGGVPIDGTDAKSRLLRELARRDVDPDRRTIVLRFLASPVRVLGDHVRGVVGVEVARNRLARDAEGAARAVATGETEVVEAGLLVRAVGYHGLPVADLPYDTGRGVIPSDKGRLRPGVYVSGWVKRGPTGFIGTNKADAAETVEQLLDDLDAGVCPEPAGDAATIASLVRRRQPAVVDLSGWQAIDREERRRGADHGRPRVKIVDVEEMLRIAHGRTGRLLAAPTRLARRAWQLEGRR